MTSVAIIVLAAAVVVTLIIVGAIQSRKRREAMAALAQRLGLSFDQERNRDLAKWYGFLNRLDRGSNRYAYNVIQGRYQEHEVMAFDYHFETHSQSKRGRRTHHHHFSFFILTLPRVFPELTIVREGLFSKVAQSFGYDDIDFESHEFSKHYCVRSKDKKFAYDVCNAQMIDYLLANRGLSLEIEDKSLALAFSSKLSVEEIEPNLRHLVAIRSRIPDYLLN